MNRIERANLFENAKLTMVSEHFDNQFNAAISYSGSYGSRFIGLIHLGRYT